MTNNRYYVVREYDNGDDLAYERTDYVTLEKAKEILELARKEAPNDFFYITSINEENDMSDLLKINQSFY